MTTEEHTSIPTDDGPMDIFVARPTGTPKGGIVVVQEAFGVTDHIKEVARRLAEAGWTAIAPAYFHRFDTQTIEYGDMENAMRLIGLLTPEGMKMDCEEAFNYLNRDGLDDAHLGIVGFCMGGSIVVYANTLRTIGAAVTYYGGGVATGRFGLPPLIELAAQMKAPWLGQFGDLDKGIPPEQVEELRTAAKALPFDTEIFRYAEAGHAFNCDDRPQSYNEAAAKLAWTRSLDWFETHIK